MSDPVARFADRLRALEARFQRMEALRARLVAGTYGPWPVRLLVACRDQAARAAAVWLTQPLPVDLAVDDNGLWCVAHVTALGWPAQTVRLTATEGWLQTARYMQTPRYMQTFWETAHDPPTP